MKKIIFLSLFSFVLCSFAVGAIVGGGDISFKTSNGPVMFSHEKHVNKGLSCQQCHPEPYVTAEKHKTATMKDMEKGLSCGLCHDGKKAFTVKANCSTCHKK